MELTKKEKLELLNSMVFIDSESESELLYYVYVSKNEENISKLSKIVGNVELFIKENNYDNEEDVIDVQFAAWDYTDSNYFDGKKFIIL